MDSTLILELEGEVNLQQFTEAVTRFKALLDTLAHEIAPDAQIEWTLQNLSYGSALVAVQSVDELTEKTVRVIEAFEQIGQSLQDRTPIPFSSRVQQEAAALSHLVRHDITALRLATSRQDNVIYGAFDQAQLTRATRPMTTFGSVKGRVQSISTRKSLHFTLYDALLDQAVRCYIDAAQREKLTDIWDQWVFVTGRVTRQPHTGRPISVREITGIDLVVVAAPGSYRQARGVLAGIDDEPAEVTIERLRSGATSFED